MDQAPQWHAHYFSGSYTDSDYDSDGGPNLAPVKYNGKQGTGAARGNVRAITNGDPYEIDDSPPPLQSDSCSDGDDLGSLYDDLTSESYGSESDDDGSETESSYDTDEEDMVRDMVREAMDAAHTAPGVLDPNSDAPEFEALAEERRDNPFLKLIGSLRGEIIRNSRVNDI